MTDWLEEIEADARLHTHIGNTTATGGGSVVIVGKADCDRLIARVRELEAQAALNASVVVAYEKLFNVAQRVTELPPPWARPNCKASAMHCWLADLYDVVVDVVKARLNAALAARETPPPDYRAARGCLPMAPDAEPSEVVIRRSRDAAGEGE